MPGDPSVEDPTRSSGPVVPPDSGEFAAVAVNAYCCLVTGVVLLWGQALEPPMPALGVAGIVAMAVLYLAFGRPQLRVPRAERRGTAVAVAILMLFAATLATSLLTTYLLFVLAPLLFRIQRLRPAVATLVVANLLPLVVALLVKGIHAPIVTVLAPRTAVAVPAVICLCYWVDRVIVQSQRQAQLVAALEASRSEIVRYSLEAGKMDERTRLAGEIHDTLAQGFTSIITLLQATEVDLPPDATTARTHIRLAVRTARENLAESRAMIAALTPAALHDTDLVDAVRRQTEALAEQTSITATTLTRGAVRSLPTAVEVVLLRSAQEAIANVRRHADAQRVTVLIDYDVDAVRLQICDDGRGFDPTAARSGYGLTGMRSRVEQVNGTVTVTTRPQHGTTIEVLIPT